MTGKHGSGDFVVIRDFVNPSAVRSGPLARGGCRENSKPPPTVGLHARQKGNKERPIVFFPTVQE